MTERLEPTTWQIRASYKNPVNVKLARALWAPLSWGTYDPFAAHRWALKLIKADPQTGADVVKSLVNYDHMIDGALAAYEMGKPTMGKAAKCYDQAAEIFKTWKVAA